MSPELILVALTAFGSLISLLLDERIGRFFTAIFKRSDKILAEKIKDGEVESITKEEFERLKGQLKRRDDTIRIFRDRTHGYNDKLGSEPALPLMQARDRIKKDETRIQGNANQNLVLGGFLTLIAISWLGFSLAAIEEVRSPDQQIDIRASVVLSEFLPRAALGILIQFIGFFFLRLYVANQNDIRQARNEITNLDLRLSALGLSNASANSLAAELAKILAQEERNFVLNKGQTSVSHQERSEFNDLTGLIDSITLKGAPSKKPAEKEEKK